MRYSQRYFEFPVRVYDQRELKRAELSGAEDTADFVIGFVGLPYWELERIYIFDSYAPDISIDEVKQEGFPCTGVNHPVYGEFLCVWPKEKFKLKLDKFVEWYEAEEIKEEEEQLAKEEAKKKTRKPRSTVNKA